MLKHKNNGWFHRNYLTDVAAVIFKTAVTEPTRWVDKAIDCKYVEIRVDMRTGDFCLKNSFNNLMTDEDILAMFPDLAKIEIYDPQN